MDIQYPLPKEAVSILNELIQQEYNAASLKQYISTCCLFAGYPIAAKYYHEEAAKEMRHANTLSEYMVSRGVEVEMPEIEEPEIKFTDLTSGIKANYSNEIEVTKAYDEATRTVFVIDMLTFNILNGFVEIQKEEIEENRKLYMAFEYLSEADQKQMESQYFDKTQPQAIQG